MTSSISGTSSDELGITMPETGASANRRARSTEIVYAVFALAAGILFFLTAF